MAEDTETPEAAPKSAPAKPKSRTKSKTVREDTAPETPGVERTTLPSGTVREDY